MNFEIAVKLPLLIFTVIACSQATFAQLRITDKRKPPEPVLNPNPQGYLEITSVPKVGESVIWVMRTSLTKHNPPSPPREPAPDQAVREVPGRAPEMQGQIGFFHIEKKQTLEGAALVPKESKPFMGQYRAWSIQRQDSGKLIEILKKFSAWSDVARKNSVTAVHKEIGALPTSSDILYFDVSQGRSGVRHSLIIQSRYARPSADRSLTPNDVSAWLDLLGRLPALEATKAGEPAPKRPTDDLFK